MDLNGRTITFAAWWDASPSNDKSASGKELQAQQAKVEKEYNVKIKYVNVPFNDFQKKFTTSVLSGQPFADVVRLQYDWALNAAANKQIMPVSSFAPDMSKYPHLISRGQFFGQNYAFDTSSASAAGIYYNPAVFKKLNLPDPHQLVKEGKWTWAEFEKIAKEATKDTNGDGKNDTWGFSGWDQEMMQFFLPSNGASMVDLKTGKVDLSNQKVVQAYDFVNKLYNTDHVVKVEPKSTPDTWTERQTFKDGDVAMTYGWDWEGSGQWKDMDYGFVQFPKGPSLPAGSGFVNPYYTGGTNDWFMPKGVKNPQAVMQIYNDLNNVKSLEDYVGQNYFEQNFKHQADIDAARSLSKKVTEVPYTLFDASKNNPFPNINMMTDIITKHKSVTSVMKSYQSKAQAAVDSVLKSK